MDTLRCFFFLCSGVMLYRILDFGLGFGTGVGFGGDTTATLHTATQKPLSEGGLGTEIPCCLLDEDLNEREPLLLLLLLS